MHTVPGLCDAAISSSLSSVSTYWAFTTCQAQWRTSSRLMLTVTPYEVGRIIIPFCRWRNWGLALEDKLLAWGFKPGSDNWPLEIWLLYLIPISLSHTKFSPGTGAPNPPKWHLRAGLLLTWTWASRWESGTTVSCGRWKVPWALLLVLNPKLGTGALCTSRGPGAKVSKVPKPQASL